MLPRCCAIVADDSKNTMKERRSGTPPTGARRLGATRNNARRLAFMRVLRVPSGSPRSGPGRINVTAPHGHFAGRPSRAALVLIATLALWLGWGGRQAPALQIAEEDDPTLPHTRRTISPRSGRPPSP